MAARLWVVAEVADGHLARIGAEAATLGRTLAAASGAEPIGIVVAESPDVAAGELAAYLPRTIAISAPELGGRPAAAVLA